MQKRAKKNKKGLTLVEIIIAIAILSIIASIGITTYSDSTQKADRRSVALRVAQIRLLIEQKRADEQSSAQIAQHLKNDRRFTVPEKVLGAWNYLREIRGANPCATTGNIYKFLNTIDSANTPNTTRTITVTGDRVHCISTNTQTSIALRIDNDNNWWCGATKTNPQGAVYATSATGQITINDACTATAFSKIPEYFN